MPQSRRDVDWTALSADTPLRLRTLLRDCLARDPKQRLRDIGEARRVLDQLISGAPDSNAAAASSANVAAPAHSPVWRRALPWTIAALAVVAAIAMFLLRGGTKAGSARELRLQMVMPGDTNSFAISPDGRFFAFSATAANGNGVQLWLRPLDSEVAKPLAGTESSFIPFRSPDSKSIGFFAHQAMKLLDVESGAVRTLADAPTPRGATWNRDGTILFSPAGNGPLYRIPATGGNPEQVTQQRAQDASHRFPQFLPDEHHFLFYVHGPSDVRGVYVGSLDSKEFHRICVADGPAVFVSPNHILLVRERVLYAQGFDPEKMELAGEPFPVTSGLSAGWASFMRVGASNTGLIVYRLDETTRRQVTWLDRSGRPAGTVGEPVADAASPDLSPDGRTLAITTRRGEGGAADVMLMDMSRGTLTRLTSDGGYAVWSPDGTRIAFEAARVGLLDLYWKAVGSSGPDEAMFASKEAKNLTDWSPDGKYVLFSSQSPTTARDVWALPVDGADRKPFPVAQTAAEETNGKFSPDGKWVAYQSDEAGHFEVFVRPFPGPGPAVRVSTGGGQGAFWRHDGKELFYRTTEDQLMAVSVGASGRGTLDFGLPQLLFKIKGYVVPETDGQRFLWLLPIGNVSQPPITVIVNWAAGQQQ